MPQKHYLFITLSVKVLKKIIILIGFIIQIFERNLYSFLRKYKIYYALIASKSPGPLGLRKGFQDFYSPHFIMKDPLYFDILRICFKVELYVGQKLTASRSHCSAL